MRRNNTTARDAQRLANVPFIAYSFSPILADTHHIRRHLSCQIVSPTIFVVSNLFSTALQSIAEISDNETMRSNQRLASTTVRHDLRDLLSLSYELQKEFERATSAEARKTLGQFCTPASVARFMAGLFPRFGDEIHLLDPGAGTGMLTAAVCARIISLRSPRRAHVHLFENDDCAIPYLEQTLRHCQTTMSEHGHALTYHIHRDDFVLAAGEAFDAQHSLFETKRTLPRFDCVIMNPPYAKINKDSPHARALAPIVHGQPNIYCLFLALAVELMCPGGRLIAITPRSFCNGLYFREFRRWIFDRMALNRIHLFDSRSETFREAKVLQESIITHWHRTHHQPRSITVTTSHGRDLESMNERRLPHSHIVDNSRGEMLIRVPATAGDTTIIECAERWPHRFEELGLQISTGPVVMFRATRFLQTIPNGRTDVPLLSSHNIKPFKTLWPITKKKWPLAFSDCRASQRHLVETRNYVLLKRFSAKEERRRLTAGCLLRADIAFARLALENHINYVYHVDRELTEEEVFGIAAVFNSAFLDRYFRSISGNTQVNATEIRAMKFPGLDQITAIGRRAQQCLILSPSVVEALVLEELGINGDVEQSIREYVH